MASDTMQRAAVLLRSGSATAARDLLHAVLEQEPQNVEALSLLAISHLKEQNTRAAIEILTRASQFAPDHPGILMNLGGALRFDGELRRAAHCFARTVALRPDAPLPALQLLARTQLEMGEFAQATETCNRVLSLDTRNVGALNVRGMARSELHDFAGSEADYNRALQCDPRSTEAMCNKALLQANSGRVDEALSLCNNAIALEKGSVATHRTKGAVLCVAQRWQEALACIEDAISRDSRDSVAWTLHGQALAAMKQYPAAETSLGNAIKCNSRNRNAWLMLATLMLERGMTSQALDVLTQALPLFPADTGLVELRAKTLVRMGNHAGALVDLDWVLTREPDNRTARAHRLDIHRELGNFTDALADTEKLIAGSPGDTVLMTTRGTILQQLGRLEEAAECHLHAFRLDRRNWLSVQNYGSVQAVRGLGQDALQHIDNIADQFSSRIEYLLAKGSTLLGLRMIAEATSAFDACIAEDNENAVAHYYRSLALLTAGNTRSGFQEYEWRRKGSAPILSIQGLGSPEPARLEDVRGKHLVLHAEQGLGDTIQFSRFAVTMRTVASKVTLVVHDELVSLMQGLHPEIGIEPFSKATKGDLALPLMSLPHLLDVSHDTGLASPPYLTASQERVERWEDSLGPKVKPRIGICWAGNSRHVNDWLRSIPLSQLTRLIQTPGYSFVSLQKSVRRSEEILLADLPIADFREALADLSETATLLSRLDLVIAVDTAIAHLAGALGKPVWVLLPVNADWRWREAVQDTPWYSTARLFRQTAPGSWESVINDVCRELPAFSSRQNS
jgi:tetratricopeptide (TPR) repeat protein